jgi:hypothetical protein
MWEYANLSTAQLLVLLQQEQDAHQATKDELTRTNDEIAQAKKTNALLRQQSNGAPEGIEMPLYHSACSYEQRLGVGRCTVAMCAFVHKAQADKYPAEVIAALPRDRATRRQAHDNDA